MKNAEKFRQVFGMYATQMWSMGEGHFLEWLNAEAEEEGLAVPMANGTLYVSVRKGSDVSNVLVWEQGSKEGQWFDKRAVYGETSVPVAGGSA